MHTPHDSSHHRSHAQQRIDRQMDLAAAGEAKRRREQPPAPRPSNTAGFARSLLALAIVLIVFGLVLAQASRAGLL
jgi:hypothetical protein